MAIELTVDGDLAKRGATLDVADPRARSHPRRATPCCHRRLLGIGNLNAMQMTTTTKSRSDIFKVKCVCKPFWALKGHQTWSGCCPICSVPRWFGAQLRVQSPQCQPTGQLRPIAFKQRHPEVAEMTPKTNSQTCWQKGISHVTNGTIFFIFNINHLSSTCFARNSSLISCPTTMAKSMQEQKGEERSVAKSKSTAMMFQQIPYPRRVRLHTKVWGYS